MKIQTRRSELRRRKRELCRMHNLTSFKKLRKFKTKLRKAKFIQQKADKEKIKLDLEKVDFSKEFDDILKIVREVK